MKRILIIGGGVSGLSAGIYALESGYEAIVCEKNAVAGGGLSGWTRDGYTIDNCIHWFTGTNPLTSEYAMWQKLGALDENVEIYQPETLYTSEYDGQTISLNKDAKKTLADMIALSPEDAKESEALFAAVKTVGEIFKLSGGGSEDNFAFLNRALSIPSLFRYVSMTTKDLSNTFKHPLLKRFVTDIAGSRFSSLALLFTYAIFCGEDGGILHGGSRATANRIAERFVSLGGVLYLNKEAATIDVENRKAVSVTFRDGDRIKADYIVSAIDPQITFGKLIDVPMPLALKWQYEKEDYARFSSYHCAFSCDDVTLPFQKQLVFDVPEEYEGILTRDRLSLYEYSHEESFAPKGKRILQTMIFCSEEESKWFIELAENKEAYRRKKERIACVTADILKAKFPQLGDSLRLLDVWTPATFSRYNGSRTGAYMGFIFPRNAIPFPLDSRVKVVNNLFLASQWMQSPGGLPLAALSGKRAIDTIDRLEGWLNRLRLIKR